MPSIDIINYSNNLTSNNTINQDQLLEQFLKQIEIIKDARDNKIKNFIDAYRIAIDSTYKIGDCMLLRHFLLETIEEMNKDLIENNKPYIISYSNKTYNQFVDENNNYLKTFYNDDGTLNNIKLINHLDYLKTLVTTYTSNDNIYLMPKLIETNSYELMI